MATLTAPDAVAMDSQKLDQVRQLFQQQIDEGLHPGAGLSVYRYGNRVMDVHGGIAKKEPVTADTDASLALKGSRQVYSRVSGGYVDCPVYDRYRLPPGCALQGPAIIEEQESTAVIGLNDRATIDRWLNLMVDIG